MLTMEKQATSDQPITCANCGRTIASTDEAYVWQDSSICSGCYERSGKPLYYASAKPIPMAATTRVCPACGSPRPPIKKAKGDWRLCLLLLLVGVIFGVLYGILHWGYIYVCPDCGLKLGDVA
jgi:predicted RNA-binding Zn-ribbon protein involved in translation (DUF1610 family)